MGEALLLFLLSLPLLTSRSVHGALNSPSLVRKRGHRAHSMQTLKMSPLLGRVPLAQRAACRAGMAFGSVVDLLWGA